MWEMWAEENCISFRIEYLVVTQNIVERRKKDRSIKEKHMEYKFDDLIWLLTTAKTWRGGKKG